MISFKKMWDDVSDIVKNDELRDIEILEKHTEGFLIKDKENSCFLCKDDFVDFWCNILYFNEVSTEKFSEKEENKFKYVYAVVKNLPYMNESCGTLKLLE
ncbi:hypothetical protein [Clostridium rectalis]|uniref:hypothetical protein n=1 Tax=Clostridium rectalis TaxID=2040295 RepID=UPI000F641A91|nr:hypothetical protein [Clostridium rectalis]